MSDAVEVAEFVEPSDPRWSAFLGSCTHDAYHLPGYLRFAAKYAEDATPVAFLGRSGPTGLLAPLLLRRLPPGLGADASWLDATTPYGYGSPLVSGAPDGARLTGLLAALREACRERGIVSVLFRLNPLLPTPLEPLAEIGRVVAHGESITMDLSRSRAQLDAETRRVHLHDVTKLRAGGFRPLVDDWSLLPRFVEVYRATMERVEADPAYFFGAEYFHDLRAALGDRLHLGALRSPSGEVAAANLFSATSGLVQSLFVGTADRYLKSAPSKLLYLHMRDWSLEHGDRVVNLGGGVGGRHDSLWQFKAGYSKTRATFHTYRVVVDERRYSELVARSGHREDETDFFPAYRRPAPPRVSLATS